MGAVCCGICCCAACGKAFGFANRGIKYSRVPYALLLFLCILLAVILRNNQSSFGFTLYGEISVQGCGSDCQSDQAVYRVCLALTLFFATHAFIVGALPDHLSYTFNGGYFLWKFLIFIPLLVSMFYIDAQRMDEYAQAARITSLIFLVIQCAAIIDTAYRVNEFMTSKENVVWDAVNLVASVGILIGYIICSAFMFVFFTGGGDCHLEKFILSTLIIIPIFYTIASVTEVVEHGALFVSACVSAYSTYVAYTALAANPSETCNSTITRARDSDTWQIVLGIVFTAVSVTYIAYRMGTDSSRLFGPQKDEEDADLKNHKDTEVGDSNEDEPEKTTKQLQDSGEKSKNVIFHTVMTFASMYVCMLLTRWSTQDYSDRESRYLSKENFWVQTSALWLIMLLYMWTLAAPVLFPDRDFS